MFGLDGEDSVFLGEPRLKLGAYTGGKGFERLWLSPVVCRGKC